MASVVQASRINHAGYAVATARRLPAIALVPLVVILFSVSGGLLWTLGLNYEGLSGSAASKIHPFTYLTVALTVVWSLAFGNPFRYVIQCLQRTPASFLLMVAGCIVLVFLVARSGPGMAGAVDTFVAPGLFVMLMAQADSRAMRLSETVIHALMGVNAVMALTEFVTDVRLFPYRFDGEAFLWDTRSSALHGHPLANALITACYLMALISGSRSQSFRFRFFMGMMQAAALVTFGGRSAMVVSIGLGILYFFINLKTLMRVHTVSILNVVAAVLMVMAIPLAIIVLSYAGFFDLLLSRFQSDGGSANARVEMFELFQNLQFSDLIQGPDVATVEAIRRVSGLEWGIENPIVKTVLYQGIPIAMLLTISVVLFLREVAQRCTNGVWLPMLAFSILLMTAETIGGKTTLLAQFAAVTMTMYRRDPAEYSR